MYILLIFVSTLAYFLFLGCRHPWVLNNFRDRKPIVDISIQHLANEVDAVFRERQKRDAQRVVKDFVNVVERVFFIDDCVQEDSKCPHVLLLAAVRLALEHLRGCVI